MRSSASASATSHGRPRRRSEVRAPGVVGAAVGLRDGGPTCSRRAWSAAEGLHLRAGLFWASPRWRSVARPGRFHGLIARCGLRRGVMRNPAQPWLSLDGASRVRTGDLLLAKQALYQLSYGPTRGMSLERGLARRGGAGRLGSAPQARSGPGADVRGGDELGRHGVAKRKPWPSSQPCSSRNLRCSSVSMPSASGSRPRLRVSPTIPDTSTARRRLGQVADEGPVDLEHRHRQLVQARE